MLHLQGQILSDPKLHSWALCWCGVSCCSRPMHRSNQPMPILELTAQLNLVFSPLHTEDMHEVSWVCCEQRSNKAQTAANQQQPSANGLTGGRDSTTQLLDCFERQILFNQPARRAAAAREQHCLFLEDNTTTRDRRRGEENRPSMASAGHRGSRLLCCLPQWGTECGR